MRIPLGRNASAPVVLLGSVLLAACADPGAELALRAPQTLVGLPETELLACAGVPEERTASGDGAQLTYTRTQTIVEREVEYEEFPWFGAGFPRVVRPSVSSWSRSYTCRVDATVRQGRITALTYNRNRDITLCYAILANCLPPPAP